MKIGIVGIEGFSGGKEDIVDQRVDVLKQMFNSPKKVYIQAETIVEKAKLIEADVIVCPEAAKLDLVIGDMEFVETRLERCQDSAEKCLLMKFKDHLEKEQMCSSLALSPEECKMIEGASLLTVKPVFLAAPPQIEDKKALLFAAYYHAGFISFFTAGEKDAHAWSIKKGASAWDAAGSIHSAIQQGFIRAEVISYNDLVADGSLSKAKTNNHMHLEMKEYVVQDGDYLVIRTNK